MGLTSNAASQPARRIVCRAVLRIRRRAICCDCCCAAAPERSAERGCCAGGSDRHGRQRAGGRAGRFVGEGVAAASRVLPGSPRRIVTQLHVKLTVGWVRTAAHIPESRPDLYRVIELRVAGDGVDQEQVGAGKFTGQLGSRRTLSLEHRQPHQRGQRPPVTREPWRRPGTAAPKAEARTPSRIERGHGNLRISRVIPPSEAEVVENDSSAVATSISRHVQMTAATAHARKMSASRPAAARPGCELDLAVAARGEGCTLLPIRLTLGAAHPRRS